MISILVTGTWFGTNHLVRGACDGDLRSYEDSVTAGVGTIS